MARTSSRKAEKKAGKAQKNISKEDKKGKKTRKVSYTTNIFKLLKLVHPDLGISTKAMSIMNSFVKAIFKYIAAVSSRLLRDSGRPGLISLDIEAAVKMVLSGKHLKGATSKGTVAVTAVYA